MKRTFVVPEDKEEIYEKFKAAVPEVSSKLVELMEDYVRKREAVNEGMVEQTIHEGQECSMEEDIFIGKTVKFYGIVLACGKHDPQYQQITVFLTKKHKYLVYRISEDVNGPFTYYTRDEIYEDYFKMKANAGLPRNIIQECELYLNKHSVTRTYEVLDV